ncbi:hypothetical protein MHSWG343_05510 [Candidatus Mycoplasma haematohominis]|uniref:Uncharacterized protein n=1 Tax=Candidatus Mycoplasma haematohominis TaxID=1494318 RepID=A0A478FRB2_9MOLU|nr:hypothetical protein MHSWG343_05510 [Candidatus Mycoplasma haemohominis]
MLQNAFNFLGIPSVSIGAVGGGVKIYLESSYGKLNVKLSYFGTFKKAIEEKGYKVISSSTEDKDSKFSLIHELDPHLNTLSRKSNDLFNGSSGFNLEKKVIAQGKVTPEEGREIDFTITWTQDPKTSEINNHKKDCEQALAKPFDFKDQEELEKLIKWCTVVQSNGDLLKRNGFTLLNTENTNDDAIWRQVIAGGWFTKGTTGTDYKYWEKQSFFGEDDLKKLIGDSNSIKEIKEESDVTDSHIGVFKERCRAELNKSPEIKNFPLSKYFLSGATNPSSGLKVDSFFEAAYFCTKPMKAEEYVRNNLKSQVRESSKSKGLTCSLEYVEDYTWYTHQPAQGKGFWCGVQVLYKGRAQ